MGESKQGGHVGRRKRQGPRRASPYGGCDGNRVLLGSTARRFSGERSRRRPTCRAIRRARRRAGPLTAYEDRASTTSASAASSSRFMVAGGLRRTSRYARKNFPPLRRRAFVAALALNDALRALPIGRRGEFRDGRPEAYRAALRVTLGREGPPFMDHRRRPRCPAARWPAPGSARRPECLESRGARVALRSRTRSAIR